MVENKETTRCTLKDIDGSRGLEISNRTGEGYERPKRRRRQMKTINQELDVQ